MNYVIILLWISLYSVCTRWVFISSDTDIKLPKLLKFWTFSPFHRHGGSIYWTFVQNGTAMWAWLSKWLETIIHSMTSIHEVTEMLTEKKTMLQWFSPWIASLCSCWHQHRGRAGETAGGSKLSSKINQKKTNYVHHVAAGERADTRNTLKYLAFDCFYQTSSYTDCVSGVCACGFKYELLWAQPNFPDQQHWPLVLYFNVVMPVHYLHLK